MRWFLLILLSGCFDDDFLEGGGETGSSEESTVHADREFSVTWNSGSVDLSLTGSFSSPYFGMAETGCADPGACWYSEDCIYGDLTDTWFYCHPTNKNGVSLLYGGDLRALVEGSETVFGGPSFEGTVTYYLEDGGDCWVWGHDTSYYSGLGCIE